jgi:hypothetical protein
MKSTNARLRGPQNGPRIGAQRTIDRARPPGARAADAKLNGAATFSKGRTSLNSILRRWFPWWDGSLVGWFPWWDGSPGGMVPLVGWFPGGMVPWWDGVSTTGPMRARRLPCTLVGGWQSWACASARERRGKAVYT